MGRKIKPSPAFSFYPDDWLGSTRIALMTPAEEGAYIRLLAHAWNDPDCGIPDDEAVLSKLSRLGDDWRTSSVRVRACFEIVKNGKLINKRLLAERRKQLSFQRSKSSAGKAGAAARWQSHASAIDLPLAKNGFPSPSPTPSSSPSPTPFKDPPPTPPAGGERGAGDTPKDRGDAGLVAKAFEKAEAFQSDVAKLAVQEYIGFLEQNPYVPYSRILEITNKFWNLRESLNFSAGIPADKIFAYAVREALKAKAISAAYVGKVIANATVKWRDNALKF